MAHNNLSVYSSGSFRWIDQAEGYFRTVVLSPGQRHMPTSQAALMLLAELGHSSRQDAKENEFDSSDLRGVTIQTSIPEGTHLVATCDLLVFEMDMIACSSLMSQSEAFRVMFLQAATNRLRRLHMLRRTQTADTWGPLTSDVLRALGATPPTLH